jgi:hypothetical protein
MRLIDPRGSSEGGRGVVETTFAMMAFGEMLGKKETKGGKRVFKYLSLSRVNMFIFKVTSRNFGFNPGGVW